MTKDEYFEKMCEFSSNTISIHCLLNILKTYTQEQGVKNQEIANIDELLEIILKKTDSIIKLI